MKYLSNSLTDKFERASQAFLRHVLSTESTFLDSVDRLLETCNRARRASDQAIYNELGWEPLSRIENEVGSMYRRREYPPDLRFGGIKGEHLGDDAFHLILTVNVSGDSPGHISFSNSEDLWDVYTPKWVGEAKTLKLLNEHFKGEIPPDFVDSYDEQGKRFMQARIDLEAFLDSADRQELTAEHLMFVTPNIKILFHKKYHSRLRDAFKRRPRKIAGVPMPSIILKQMLAILTTAQDILDVDEY